MITFISRLKQDPLIRLLLKTYKRYNEDSAGNLATAIAFYAFLSVYPLLLINLLILGWIFPGDNASQVEWESRLFRFIPGVRALLAHNLTSLQHARTTLGIIGFLGLIWTGISMSHAVSWTLAQIFRVSDRRGIVRRTSHSFGAIIMMSALVLVSAGISVRIGGSVSSGVEKDLFRAANVVVTLGLDFLIFWMGYRILTPHGRLPLRKLWKGAMFGGNAWTLFKLATFWYAVFVVNKYNVVHGTFAAALSVLAMLYVSACLFLYGAELNAVLDEENA